MTFSATLADLQAISAMRSAHAFLRTLPRDDRFITAMSMISHEPTDALRSAAFWTRMDELTGTPPKSKKFARLSENTLALICDHPEIVEAIHKAIAEARTTPTVAPVIVARPRVRFVPTASA